MSQSDIEHELTELRARVQRAPTSNIELSALQKAIAGVNAQWHISATLPPPAPGAPFMWRAVYFVKRVTRRVMAELLNTLVQQQNQFNREVARALTELAANEERVAELEKRIAKLEEERETSNVKRQ